jgi:hypothetical protein
MEVNEGDRITVRVSGSVSYASAKDGAVSFRPEGHYSDIQISRLDIMGRRPPIQKPKARVYSREIGEDVEIERHDEQSESYVARVIRTGALVILKDSSDIVVQSRVAEEIAMEPPPPAMSAPVEPEVAARVIEIVEAERPDDDDAGARAVAPRSEEAPFF